MKTTFEALLHGFVLDPTTLSWYFKFGDKKEYELTFEALLFDKQMYVALYKNGSLLTDKVVVKAGYVKKKKGKK